MSNKQTNKHTYKQTNIHTYIHTYIQYYNINGAGQSNKKRFKGALCAGFPHGVRLFIFRPFQKASEGDGIHNYIIRRIA